LDHASLVVDIYIIEEAIPDIRHTIIKNSEEKIELTSNIINNFKKNQHFELNKQRVLGDYSSRTHQNSRVFMTQAFQTSQNNKVF